MGRLVQLRFEEVKTAPISLLGAIKQLCFVVVEEVLCRKTAKFKCVMFRFDSGFFFVTWYRSFCNGPSIFLFL